MGRLAGFKYHDVARKLRVLGFRFDRQARAATRFGCTNQAVGEQLSFVT